MRWVLLLVACLFVAVDARADAIGPGLREVETSQSLENVDAYPDYVFYLYPTTNAGFAYRVESNRSPWKLALPVGHRAGATELWAVRRDLFAKADVSMVPHGDHGEDVAIFRPIAGAVKASLPVAPPGTRAPIASKPTTLVRVFRIEAVSDAALELRLVKSESIAAPSGPSPERPKQSGCGGCGLANEETSAFGAAALAAVLVLATTRRRR